MIKNLKSIFLGKEKNSIFAPIKGELIALSKVNDPTFAGEMLGKGVAIIPKKGKVVSPVNGKVAVILEARHAVSIVSDEGSEILIHVGIDTINLKGEYFTAYVKVGDEVKKGDLLLEFENEKIKAKGYDTVTSIVICNTSDYSEVRCVKEGPIKELDKIISLDK